jgi:hypothetical protein
VRERELLPGATRFKNQGPIIPVRWAPIPYELPAVVKDEAQLYKPQSAGGPPEARVKQGIGSQSDLAARYEEEGIFGLLRKGHDDAFSSIVWDLAKSIQQIYYNQLLKPRQFDPDELRNVFEGGA